MNRWAQNSTSEYRGLTLAILLAASAVFLVACGEYGKFVDDVTPMEMRGIIAAGDLPTSITYKLLHSFAENLPPPNNDHLNVYAFSVILTNLPTSTAETPSKWESGRETNDLHMATIESAVTQALGEKLTWFPTAQEIADNHLRRFGPIKEFSGRPHIGAFFSYDQKNQVLYYVSYKL